MPTVILTDPAAAASAYAVVHRADEQTVLVLDLGGSTLSVGVLDIAENAVEVGATCGDHHLGGDDWDERIVTWHVDRFRDVQGIDLTADETAMQRLRGAAEKAKIELSSSSSDGINLP